MESQPPSTAQQAACEQMVPLLEQLSELAEAEGQVDQVFFFRSIQSGLLACTDPDDLAGPFMELSTAAFRGHLYSPAVTFLLDQVLSIAQTLSMTLSADGAEEH
ncbi:MAG: hypothetical protein P8M78_00895 [Myxococcota bacterium]|nr:hypothetical protein [Myxococcota bacterium]